MESEKILKIACISKEAAPTQQYVAGVTPIPPVTPAASAAYFAPRGQKTDAAIGAGAGSLFGGVTGAFPGASMIGKGNFKAGLANALLGSAAGSAVGSGLGYDLATGQF